MRYPFSCTFLLLLLLGIAHAQDNKAAPPFFLQDPSDSLCLAGEEFRRCSIDTLFSVVGTPGNYQILKRPLSEEEDDDVCLSKKSCSEKDFDKKLPAKLAKCSHCGAKHWNILGDAETGYILTEGEEGQLCLMRGDDNKAFTVPCNQESVGRYTPLQLQFASASDITAMSSPAARLIGAASDGDKKLLQTLLKEEDLDVDVRDWDDLTALIPAASSGHLDIVKLLIKEKCDVNAKDKDGITALMEASIMGHAKIVETLLGAGAEVDAKANSEVTALWLAAGEGKVDAMKVLLKKGADAAVARVDGISALSSACAGGHVEAVKLLLDSGADPRATDNDDLTPLMNAAENGNVEVMKLLVDKAGESDPKYVDAISTTGFTATIIAAAHGLVDVISYLIDQGANVNAVHDNGVNALMYAASSGYLDAMKLLIEKGNVDVNARHQNGGTALLEASTGGAVECIKLLIEKGAEFDFLDDDGVTPLMAVASMGHVEAQTLIIDSLKTKMNDEELKKHINLPSYSGGTSVMFSAASGHVECTKQLIELGADVNAIARATPEYLVKIEKMIEEGTYQDDEPHVDGVTGLHVAAQSGHLECVKLLLEAGADVSVKDDESRSALLVAVKNNHGEVSAALVAAGADPNTEYTDDEGNERNLLMDAITVENVEFASLLIEKGADLYHVDERKVTTLLQAAHRGLTDVVKLLLEKNSQNKKEGYLDSPSDEGITPLIAASSEGHGEIVKLLIAAKADLNAKDNDSTNALMAASARGHANTAELLLEAGANVNEQNADGHTALMFAYNGKNQVETLWERYNQFVVEQQNAETKQEGADDGTGPLIQQAMDNHTALVQLLLKNGADASLKDKEGHTASDFDFHPDQDSDVLEKEAKAEKSRDESKNEL